MKRMLVAATAVLATLSWSPMAQAQNIKTYGGVGMGSFSVEYKAPGINQKKSSIGGFAKAGAEFNEYVAAEMRLGATGNNKQIYAAGGPLGATGGTLTVNSPIFFSLLGKFNFDLSSDFRVYALAGGTMAKVRLKQVTNSYISQNQIATGASAGLGAELYLDSRSSVGVEWVQYMFPVKLSAGSVAAAGSKARMYGISGVINYSF